MIIYDQLRISDNGQSMFIDAHVNKAEYFDDIVIKKVTVCAENQVSEVNPYGYGDDFIYQETFQDDTPVKEVHLVLNSVSFNENFSAKDLSHNMFFVYVECDGTPAPDTPCTLDELVTLGVTFDYGTLFGSAMNYTKELGDTCNVSQNFIDFILNMEAMKISIETEHYIPAIKYWKWLLDESTNQASADKTGCCGCKH